MLQVSRPRDERNKHGYSHRPAVPLDWRCHQGADCDKGTLPVHATCEPNDDTERCNLVWGFVAVVVVVCCFVCFVQVITGGEKRKLSGAEQIAAGFVGGALSGLACAPMELVMVQQQRFGGSYVTRPH